MNIIENKGGARYTFGDSRASVYLYDILAKDYQSYPNICRKVKGFLTKYGESMNLWFEVYSLCSKTKEYRKDYHKRSLVILMDYWKVRVDGLINIPCLIRELMLNVMHVKYRLFMKIINTKDEIS